MSWIEESSEVLVEVKILKENKDLVEHILRIFLSRPSNVPKYFFNYYKSTAYWNLCPIQELPRIPEYLLRFTDINPVPIIAERKKSVVRKLVTGTVPCNSCSLDYRPAPQEYFENPTGTEFSRTAGQYPVFIPTGFGPWAKRISIVKHQPLSLLTPTPTSATLTHQNPTGNK